MPPHPQVIEMLKSQVHREEVGILRATGNGAADVCANNLLRIARGEVPFERVKGLDPRMIDRPISEAQGSIRQDAEWLLNTYEPRVTVNSINIDPVTGTDAGFVITADVTETEV